MRTFSYTGDSSRRRAFTLVELLAAMAIFTVMLGMVFAMLAGAQRAWSAVDRNTRIYENARILMDLITRDLQCAIASDTDGQEIPFTADPGTITDQDLLAFVAAVDPPSEADSRLCEILYAWENYVFKRSCIGDNTESAWNFYTITSGGAWATSDPNRRQVINGVEDISFACFGEFDSADDSDGDGMLDSGATANVVPNVVRVSFTLFDPSALDVPAGERRNQLIKQSRRSFNKIIFLRAE